MVRVFYRLAPVLAVGLAAACFVDAPVDSGPGGSGATTEAGSTGGSTTDATTTEATSESSSASATATATTDATTTSTSTSTTTTTTTEGKTTTGDPSTTAADTSPMTSTTTTTSGSTTEPLGWDDCKFASEAHECDLCCAFVIAASAHYFEVLAACSCSDDNLCSDLCEGNLCAGSVYSAACLECLKANKSACLEEAELACLTDDQTNCDDYHECKAENGCDDKP